MVLGLVQAWCFFFFCMIIILLISLLAQFLLFCSNILLNQYMLLSLQCQTYRLHATFDIYCNGLYTVKTLLHLQYYYNLYYISFYKQPVH